MRDYPFLPAYSPWFDPFPLLQHQPPSLRPAGPHLWLNWAQWLERFYFHWAGHTPRDISGVSYSWLQEAVQPGPWKASLFGMLFSLRRVGFQKQLSSWLSCLCYLWIEHFCKVTPLGCLFCVYQSAHMERVALWTVKVWSFLWLLVKCVCSGPPPTLYFSHSFTLSSTRNNN